MPILTSAPSALDSILTLALVAVLALVVIIAVICKAVSKKKAATVSVVAEEPVAAEAPTAPGSAGQLKLHDVEPKTAAMLMAIIADKLQKPLNELRFTSIKEVK
jgi:3-oxoacyl-ACP reductase-like protein